MTSITSTNLARLFDRTESRVKRHVREFLGTDSITGQQKGYARKLSMEEAFTVYLGGFLVSELQFSVFEVRKILDDLKPWFIKNKIYPISWENWKLRRNPSDIEEWRKIERDPDNVKWWKIRIFTLENTLFYYEAKGQFEFEIVEKTKEKNNIYSEKYIIKPFMSPELLIEGNVAKIEQAEVQKHLPISRLINMFLTTLKTNEY